MGAGQGPLHVEPAPAHRVRVGAPDVTCLSTGGRAWCPLAGLTSESVVEARLVVRRGQRVGPGWEAETGTSLHGAEAVGIALDTAPAVTASLLYGSPDFGAQGPPRCPAAGHFIGEGQ